MAPASRSARGPASYAAPSAQSSTTVSPVSGWRSVASRWAAYSSTAVGWVRHPADRTAGRAVPVLVQVPLDLGLDRVVELDAAAGEELDAVVGHRVVGGGEHHAEVGAERAGEVGDARRGQHPEQQDVDPRRGQAGDDGRLEELSGDARVPADDGERAVALELAPVGQDTGGSNGKVQGQLSGQMTVGQAPDPVRAEEFG